MSATEMTVLDKVDDDALRFVQRVLETDYPVKGDRELALKMIIEIRTRLRGEP